MWRFLPLGSYSHKKGPNFARRDIQRCDSVLASSCSLICLKAGGAESSSESLAPLNQTQPEGKNWAAFEQQLTCLPAFLIWVSAAGGRISRVISSGTLTSDIKPLKTSLKNLSLCLCAKLKQTDVDKSSAFLKKWLCWIICLFSDNMCIILSAGPVPEKEHSKFLFPLQDGKTPMETLYSWQNGAKSLLCNFSEEKLDQ